MAANDSDNGLCQSQLSGRAVRPVINLPPILALKIALFSLPPFSSCALSCGSPPIDAFLDSQKPPLRWIWLSGPACGISDPLSFSFTKILDDVAALLNAPQETATVATEYFSIALRAWNHDVYFSRTR